MYTIGIDFGTNSVPRHRGRRAPTARVVGTRVVRLSERRSGRAARIRRSRISRGRIPPTTSRGCARRSAARSPQADAAPGFSRDRVIGIGVDTTGSTPLPVDAQARPLALDPALEGQPRRAGVAVEGPHGGRRSGARSPRSRSAHAPQYLAPIGGTYSSEWWWSKIWHCLKVAPDVFDAAASWVELADFVPAVLAGVDDPTKIVRCVCAAGHKAMYSDAWGGLPSKAFLARLDPKLADLRDRLYDTALAAGHARRAALCREWAQALGLREGIAIAMGGFDAHYGAVGSGIAGRHARQDHRHVDLRLRDRAGRRDRIAAHPGHLRHRQRLDHAGLLRHRGGAVGGRRHAQMVGRGRLRRATTRCTRELSREAAAHQARASRGCSRSTGTTATAPCSSIRGSPG